jgi:hypothetical protein
VGTNKQFDNILNECLEKLITGQETVEQCLQRYPQYAAELEPLLRTATMVNKAVDVKPSAEFRAKARYEMQLKMAQSKAPARAPTRTARFVPRWAIAVGAVMLVFVLGGGSVLASNNVMPGNILYGVKLVKETVQVKLAGSTEKKTELYVTMAANRVNEMTWMASNNKTQNIEAAALRLDNYYTQIGKLASVGNNAMVFTPYNSSNQSNTFSWGATTTETQSGTTMTQAATTQLAGAGKSAPPNPATTTTAAATITPTVTSTVVAPVTTPTLSAVAPYTPAPTTAVTTTNVNILPITIPPETSTVITVTQPATTFVITQPAASSRSGIHDNNVSGGNSNQVATNNGLSLSASNYSSLMNILLYNSVTQPEEIQKLLDSNQVPESVKPTLRRALAASQINYQNAINNFSSSNNNSTAPGNP